LLYALAACKVASGSERDVAKKLVEFKEVTHADIVFGEYNVIATMPKDNLVKLEEFVSESIRNVPNILVTSTVIISREYKSKEDYPKSK
jgi:DNA-binding Lrp family transcriptional regulator